MDTLRLLALLFVLALSATGCKKEEPTEPKDTTPPTVSILNPLNNSAVTDTVLIQIQATDNSGVTKVEFYVDGILVLTKGTAPWEYKWPTRGLQVLSTHTIMAKAYDAFSNVGTSPTVTVVIKDVTIPTASIASPTNNSVVSDTVTITVQATDDVAITKVEFYIDANLAYTKTASPWQYKWPTRGLVSLSAHTILAKAYDSTGNVGTSQTVSVIIKDVVPPVVAILSPADNAPVQDTVLVQVQATDDVGVTKVEFYIDGTLIHTKTSAPWQYTWITINLAPQTLHTIVAKAYDAAGNAATSSTINITIRQPVGSITGTILNAVSSNPIAVVQVSTQPPTSVTSTDNSGNYTISGVLPGTYKVVASGTNYRSDSTTVSVGRWATVRVDFRLFKISTMPTSGLVAYYPFIGNANDVSGNSNNCTVVNAGLSADRFGNPNRAYSFNGTSSYLISAKNIGISGASPRTISIWVYPRAFSSAASVCGWGRIDAVGGMSFLKLLGSSPLFNGHWQDLTASDTIKLNTWCHICFTFANGVGRMYLNGLLAGNQSLNLNAIDTKFSLGYEFGGHGSDWNQYLNGVLADARVYSRALTDQEVLLLYNEPDPGR